MLKGFARVVAARSSSTASLMGYSVPSDAIGSIVRASTNGQSRSIAAITAALRFKQRTRGRSGVLTVAAEPMTAGRQRVYNLSVDQAEEYFANGVLVHNCRYACASRPWVRTVEPPPVIDTWARAFARANREDVADWRVA
jgi:hypothetical protein